MSIAGVIIEPVLGEGGFLPAAEGFLADLSQVCARNDALLIADEVQSGYGRTGRFLASQWSDVRADVVILGKSIAAGLPLSAVVSEPRHIDSLIPNALGGTYPGNPVACAMAVATLEVIESEHLVDRALRVGEILRESWQALSDKYGGVVSMRGLGSMIGVELESPAAAADLVSGALQAGVMLMTAGRDGEAIRHLMPLVMTDEQLGEAFEAIEKVLAGRG